MPRERESERAAAGSVVAMIDYLMPEVVDIDPIAAHFLRLSRELLAGGQRAGEVSGAFRKLWRGADSPGCEGPTFGAVRPLAADPMAIARE